MSRRQHGSEHGPVGGSDKIRGVRAVCHGQIDGPGLAIRDAGSGDWTFTTDDVGHWTITFDRPFPSPPTVVVSENATSTVSPNFVQESAVSASSFDVTTYEPSTLTAVGDIGFNFTATWGDA